MGRPKIATVGVSTLIVLGLKQLLQNVMPIMTIDSFSSFQEFERTQPNSHYHYLMSQVTVLENGQLFSQCIHKTTVLTITKGSNTQLSGFHSLCINAPKDEPVEAILKVVQYGRSSGKNLPKLPQVLKNKILNNREMEVLSLIVQGLINKKITEELNTSLTTVITHRKNIMDKLEVKSVSALTIYAVMYGYIDINKI